MKLTVVIPVYNEQDMLPTLRERLTGALDAIDDCDWQVIYVNDGSRDDSSKLIAEQAAADARFAAVEFSRNFGQQAALTAGLHHAADADAVVLIDADLQDPPEVIADLVAAWRDGGQVVVAQRRSRAERGLRGFCLRSFHHVFAWISDFPVVADAGVFALLDRRAVAEFNRLPEKNRFIPGLRSWIGFDQRLVGYDRADRAAGAPKQTFRRLMRYALDGVTSFSYKPLRLMTGAGALISFIGFALACFYAGKRLLGIETAPTGFTTLVTLMLFLGGIQLIAVGLLGEYLARIYDEVKRRPLYIVRDRRNVSAPREER